MAKFIEIQIFIFVLAFYSATGTLHLGKCPYVLPKADANIKNMLGRWYVHSAYPLIGDDLIKCSLVDFDQLQNDKLISVSITTTSIVSDLQHGISGEALVNGPGTLRLRPGGIAGILGDEVVSILDTDNVNYAVIYACERVLGIGLLHNRYAWILTRSRQPDNVSVLLAKSALRNRGLSVRDLKATSQLACPAIRK